jgi:hypothetical protein
MAISGLGWGDVFLLFVDIPQIDRPSERLKLQFAGYDHNVQARVASVPGQAIRSGAHARLPAWAGLPARLACPWDTPPWSARVSTSRDPSAAQVVD